MTIRIDEIARYSEFPMLCRDLSPHSLRIWSSRSQIYLEYRAKLGMQILPVMKCRTLGVGFLKHVEGTAINHQTRKLFFRKGLRNMRPCYVLSNER